MTMNIFVFVLANIGLLSSGVLTAGEVTKPVRSELVVPIRNATFNKDGKCREKRQGGNPRQVSGHLVFDGATDGNRQVDPQIAVGGGYVVHATNTGLTIYNKKGEFVQGVSQNCFNGGIDPKLFYDAHNEVFGFDLWNPWDKEMQKPVNISVSETNDPTGAWNTYPVPAPAGRDGGGIGYSRMWIGYSFPGGPEQTFVLRTAQAKSGKPATVFHFKGNLGHPVATQDANDDLYFVRLTRRNVELTRVYAAEDGDPVAATMAVTPHNWESFDWPPPSPQKGTDKRTASGDRNPKNIVLQSKHLWFSQTINHQGRAAVRWNQITLAGETVQSGLMSHPTRSFIQTTLAVNKQLDVLVGFQETGPDMFISPRCAFRSSTDAKGVLRTRVRIAEGKAATEGGAWGDYSGSVVDGDNHRDLWSIQSVADESGRGDTVIVRVRRAPLN